MSQKNSQELPEDDVDQHRNAPELKKKWLAYKKYALIFGYGRVTSNTMQGVNNVKIEKKKRVSDVQSL